jgi:hypothetical protein
VNAKSRFTAKRRVHPAGRAFTCGATAWKIHSLYPGFFGGFLDRRFSVFVLAPDGHRGPDSGIFRE